MAKWRDVRTLTEAPFIPGEEQPHWKNERAGDFKPLTEGQARYMAAMEKATVTLVNAPAGTGKTWMAAGYAARLLKSGKVKKIVLTRPMVSCGSGGKGIGFMPGNKDEKMLPFMTPLIDAFEDHLGREDTLKRMKDGTLEMAPLELMRGSSFRNSFVICDEAQNAEYEQLHMLLTRFGKNCRVVVCGHPRQTDIRDGKENPFAKVFRLLTGRKEIAHIIMTEADVVRHELTGWIDTILSDCEHEFFPIQCPVCDRMSWTDEREQAECCFCSRILALWDEHEELNPALARCRGEDCARSLAHRPNI